jgi:hypothetical protein
MHDTPRPTEDQLELLEMLADERGRALATDYGAHAIGVGREIVDGKETGRLALRFYFSPNFKPANPLPETIRYEREGAPAVDLPTCAIYTVAVMLQPRERVWARSDLEESRGD